MNMRSIYAKPMLPGFLALAFILISQHEALADLWKAWQTEEYSHGILIPLIALLLAWHRLTETKPAPRPSRWGICWLVAGGLMQFIASLSAFQMAAQYGLIIELTGLSLAFLGVAATRAMAPTLLYLIFAVPLPHLVQANLSQQLQLWSSSLGVLPLDLLGIPVFQQGNVIDLGGYRLQVVEACSGLRYLFPLMSFGYLIAFLLKDRWWKRLIIFFSTIPIAIILNALRISFIGFTVDKWGQEMAKGLLHDFEGWSVFLVCVFILLIETWMLRSKDGQFRYEYFGRAHGALFSNRPSLDRPGITAVIIAAIFAIVFGSGIIDQRKEITPSHTALANFPVTLGEWRGRPDALTQDVLQALQLSDYWLADYRGDSDIPVNLYIAYYASQRSGSTTHSPSNCLPGGGWQIANSRIETAKLANGTNLKFTRLIIRRGDSARLVYYWFDERGRNLTENYSAKWYLIWDSIFMHRTDGALIRLITAIPNGEGEAAAEKRLNQFLELLTPQIPGFIPGAAAN